MLEVVLTRTPALRVIARNAVLLSRSTALGRIGWLR